jgi:tRNA U34 2-thiouridine synthase MnmA/TrmU
MNVRALALMSGGLDSILAVKVVLDQNIEVCGIAFETPFFNSEGAQKAVHRLGIPLRVVDISAAYLEILRNPRYGYGRQMNPCIDCHGLMVRTAGTVMETEGYDFLVTGEVVGQRPMSQRKDALMSVDKLSGYKGRVVRPLSAKLLPITLPEQEGKVDRERLLDIHGRSRKRQMALAAQYGIDEYPTPGGGCLLTNSGFAGRLRDLFATKAEVELRDIELLKWGRHLRLPGGSRLIVGRVHADNVKISELSRGEDVLLKVNGVPGPTGLMPSGASEEEVKLAAALVAAYSDAATGTQTTVSVSSGRSSWAVTVPVRPKEEFRDLLI